LAHTLQLLRHPLIGRDNFIKSVGDLSVDPKMIARHSHRKVATSHRLEHVKQLLRGIGLPVRIRFDFGTAPRGWGGTTEITHGISFEENTRLNRPGASDSRA
jgi:hypothetical protein